MPEFKFRDEERMALLAHYTGIGMPGMLAWYGGGIGPEQADMTVAAAVLLIEALERHYTTNGVRNG